MLGLQPMVRSQPHSRQAPFGGDASSRTPCCLNKHNLAKPPLRVTARLVLRLRYLISRVSVAWFRYAPCAHTHTQRLQRGFTQCTVRPVIVAARFATTSTQVSACFLVQPELSHAVCGSSIPATAFTYAVRPTTSAWTCDADSAGEPWRPTVGVHDRRSS